MQYAYFIVEGHHDIAAIGRVLKYYHFKKIRLMSELDEYWKRTVPNKYPHNDNLLERMPVPEFFKSNDISLAIISANNKDQIPGRFRATKSNIDADKLVAVGLFCDADLDFAKECCSNLSSCIVDPWFEVLEIPGQVYGECPRIGVYVFPDNNTRGTLEDVLLRGAEVAYPTLLSYAREYVEKVEHCYKSLWRGADGQKVIVGCVGNILSPGKSNQVIIQDNDWISEKTLNIEPIKALNDFICNLLNLAIS